MTNDDDGRVQDPPLRNIWPARYIRHHQPVSIAQC